MAERKLPSGRNPYGIGRGRARIPEGYQNPLSASTFQIGPDEQQSFWEQLMKVIGTQTATARNVATEQSVLSMASDPARAASLRGVDYRSGMALEKGGFDLMKWIEEYNRQGVQQAFQNRMAHKQYQLAKEAQEGSFWDDLMSILTPVVGGAGYAFGQSLFKN